MSDTADSVVSEYSERIPIKHAAVTYSRKHLTENDRSSASHSVEREGVYATIRPSVADELYFGSELSCISTDSEHHETAEAGDPCPKYVFAWQKKLKEYDQEFNSSPLSNSNANDVLLTRKPHKEPSEVHESGTRHSLESPKQRTSSNDILTVVETITSPSTPGIGPKRRHPVYRASMRDSDSESEPSHKKRWSSTKKSSPFVFQTPNSRSSPTPPTSADETLSLPILKGKGKASAAPRRCVSPLRFSEELSEAESESSASNKQKRAPRVKAPTKKDRLETAKNSVRLAANQHVSIHKAESNCKFTFQNFLTYINEKDVKQASDPIVPFSSSPLTNVEIPVLVSRHGPSQMLDTSDNGAHSTAKGVPDAEPLSVEKDSKMKELQMMKQRALALQSIRMKTDEDEDDLEIIADDESTPFVSKQSRPIRIRKQETSFRVVALPKPNTGSVIRPETKNRNLRLGIKGNTSLTQVGLSRMLVEQVAEHNKRLTMQKDEEWVKRGGRLKTLPAGDSQDTLSTYVQKGLEKSSKARLVDPPLEGDSDGSETTDDDDQEATAHQTIEGDPQYEEPVDDESEDEAPRIKKWGRQNVAVLDSDSESENHAITPSVKGTVFKFGNSSLGSLTGTDESDENSMPPPTFSFSSIHRGSVSSVDDQAEDRSDKENNRKLMFDKSEDKENNVTFRYDNHTTPKGPMTARATSLFFSDVKDLDDEDVLKDDERLPLTVLSEDKSSILQPDLSWTDTLSLQNRRSISPVVQISCPDERSPSTQGKHPSASAKFGVPHLLQTDFAELFESGTEDPKKARVSIDRFPGGSPGSLELTQDVRLQPAFNIGDQLLLRKADSIFEKEQAYLFEAGNNKAEKKQLYVNDFGFLTQTLHHDEDMELYRSPYFTQRKSAHGGPSGSPTKDSGRHPLSTLSLSMPQSFLEMPIGAPRRRLVKRSSPSPIRSVTMRDSNSPTPAPPLVKNAFDTLVQGSKYLARRGRQKLEKSEFVESEAEESDDDDVFGLPKKNDEDEDEDSNDLDQTLETLVDDRHMDADILNAPLVIEKFKEDMEQEDQELEKLHQAAAQGELRRKRRNRGIGLDDSDEEDDEDERARKIRRKMSKSQRIDRGDIKALAKNEETLPFFRTYENGILDDGDIEFQEVDVIMGKIVNDDEQDEQKYVTREEIQDHARELARRKEIGPTLDPHDVSWIDAEISDEEIGLQVRIANEKKKRRGGLEKDFDDIAEMSKPPAPIADQREKSRMQSWARIEGKSRRTAVRPGGGVAVTGHAKSKPKMDGGLSIESTLQRNSRRKPLKATPSMLAEVLDRSTRFR